MIKTIIKGIGSFLPNRIVKNKEVSEFTGVDDEWIYKRTGIKERRWVENGNITASNLAKESSLLALKDADWNVNEIDYIMFSTQTPDLYIPGTAPILQTKLKIEKNVQCLDIRQNCMGFINGLQLADSLIRSGYSNKLLFTCAEVQSTGINLSKEGRNTSILFGDGAGSVCLESIESDENIGIISSSMYTDGYSYKNIHLDLSPRNCIETIKKGKQYAEMNGKRVFIHAVKRLPKVIDDVLQNANMTIDDIDIFIPHQANQRINDNIAEKMNIPADKMYSNIIRYGNTTSATIPIALNDARKEKTFRTIMFLGYGAGEHWGAIIYKHISKEQL